MFKIQGPAESVRLVSLALFLMTVDGFVTIGQCRAQPIASTEESDADPATPKRPALGMPTIGGKQFWTDHLVYGGWRIQQHAITGHFRLLDDNDRRYVFGSFEKCRDEFERLRGQRQLPPLPRTVVVTIHGLGRTRGSMEELGGYLAEHADVGWINFGYASTRLPLARHAEALDHVLSHLPEVETVHVVGHSLGNLVLRHYLHDRAQAEVNGDAAPGPTIGRIVMLGPPNQGATLARKLEDNSLFQVVLGVGGDQLANRWAELEQQLAIPSQEFGIVAGSIAQPVAGNPGIEGRDDLVVSVEETRLVGARDSITVPVAHTFLMDDKQVREATLSFLLHGYFISEDERQPITEP